MQNFKLISDFKDTGDQPQAIQTLVANFKKQQKYQVLLGVTGSGKTYTMARVIAELNIPTLVISHNKTLAAQTYQELKSFFPKNCVSYFVSYYDFYQPEAYLPQTDTYIEKDADINEEIDKLRLAATTNVLTRKDTIIVASVSCIYNIGSPKEYGRFVLEMSQGMAVNRNQIIDQLLNLQYERSDFGFHRSTFRIRGNTLDIYPAYREDAVRLEINNDILANISLIDPVSGVIKEKSLQNFVLYPAKHFMSDPATYNSIFREIRADLAEQVNRLSKIGKDLEAKRLSQKVNYDLMMIKEMGYVKGIENYSRYFDGRSAGDAPNTLLDYFHEPYQNNWLVIVDESHITFPQIRGMYAGDRSRKETLIEYGFRLPSALDNRPLTFEEFMRRIPNFIATSATPANWEISLSDGHIAQQLVRPTGIPDPLVEIKPTATQVANCIEEIKKRSKLGQRCLITTLTKKSAEDLAEYLTNQNLKVHYLHSDIKTLERTDLLDELRKGAYDCLIGINLLREGLDLPEVSLVAILDADKEGFLRSEVSLIQTMGRAARHVDGKVILYADKLTNSIKNAIHEVKRRRKYQIAVNKKLGIIPRSIIKPFREKMVEIKAETFVDSIVNSKSKLFNKMSLVDANALTAFDKGKLAAKLKIEMRIAARNLDFELAAAIRDRIKEIIQ